MQFPERIPIPEEVTAIARRLEEAGHEAWCVGGAVRDTLLGDVQKDFDLATSATPEQVQALFPRTVAVGVKYGTVGVLDRDRVLHEVTTFRHDVRTDGRHAEVAYGVSLEEDLARRDFTVNAIAYHPLRAEWRDPFAGAEDLERRRLRAVGDPAARFREDYLRVLRALRFAARLEFVIDPATWEAAAAAADGLGQLSAERVRDEWVKGLATTRSLRRLISLWRKSGAAAVWLPELWSAEELEAWTGPDAPTRRDPVVLTALCCHGPVAVLARLRMSNSDLGPRGRAGGRHAGTGREHGARRPALARRGGRRGGRPDGPLAAAARAAVSVGRRRRGGPGGRRAAPTRRPRRDGERPAATPASRRGPWWVRCWSGCSPSWWTIRR